MSKDKFAENTVIDKSTQKPAKCQRRSKTNTSDSV